MTARAERPADLTAMFAIRDARGLSASEKVFLFTVASRGTMFTGSEVAAADMGLSRATFHRVRGQLVERHLLSVQCRPGKSSKYTLDVEAVRQLIPRKPQGGRLSKASRSETPSLKVSQPETPQTKGSHHETPRKQSQPETRGSHHETGVSQSETHKKNTKKTEKNRQGSKRTLRKGSGYLGDLGEVTLPTSIPTPNETGILEVLRQYPKGIPMSNLLRLIGLNSLEGRDELRELARQNKLVFSPDDRLHSREG